MSTAAAAPHPGTSAVEPLPELDIPDAARQNRLTVLLRVLLLVPQLIVLFFLGIAGFFATVAAWFAGLVLGRLPAGLAGFLTGVLRYDTRVTASLMLLVDRYPPFALEDRADYPVRIEVRPVPLNRLAVFFRILLMIPAVIVESLATGGWWAVSFLIWLVVLVLGRMPKPLFQATAAILRYRMRLGAYLMMITSAYPKRLFGDPVPVGAAWGRPQSATRPLLMGTGGRVLVIVFLVLGLLSGAGSGGGASTSDTDGGTNAAARLTPAG
ncbi:DUF4389 domain-containing protein [Phaeacidiphilus oryzae]|uniref:DUF4389 domain-containing protein n=1 Tax=Phaeacidiphilus oryzae TaxID=348818 RepID=UPI0006903827|nr:DUF4389 domain-containing protein [Phaeacidiphilus oryzae]